MNDTEVKIIVLVLFWGMSVIILGGSILYIIMGIRKHKKRKNDYLSTAGIDSKNLNQDMTGLAKLQYITCNKRLSYISNYYLFQTISKVSGFSGVIFSILGLYFSAMRCETFDPGLYSIIASFISLICFFIALYVAPTTRISEYYLAWKTLDNALINAVNVVNPADKEKYDKAYNDLNTAYESAEQCLESDKE